MTSYEAENEMGIQRVNKRKSASDAMGERLTDMPLIFSVANDDDAIALPHPKVLNFASVILPA